MAYICVKEKGSCSACENYRYDADKNRNICFAAVDEKVKTEIDDVLRQMCFGTSLEYTEDTVERIFRTNTIELNCIQDNISVNQDIVISALLEIASE